MHQFILALHNPEVQGLVFVGVMQLKLRSGFFGVKVGFQFLGNLLAHRLRCQEMMPCHVQGNPVMQDSQGNELQVSPYSWYPSRMRSMVRVFLVFVGNLIHGDVAITFSFWKSFAGCRLWV